MRGGRIMKQGVERKRRQQQLQRKRKRRRQLIIYRCVLTLIFIGMLLVGIKMISYLYKKIINPKDIEVTSVYQVSQPYYDENQLDKKYAQSIKVGREALEKGHLIVVNEENPLRNYNEEQLVKVENPPNNLYSVSKQNLRLQKDAENAFDQMLEDFKQSQPEEKIGIISGYRDYEEQQAFYYESMKEQVNEDPDVVILRPDRSEHHTGLALDLGIYNEEGKMVKYKGKGKDAWIRENSYRYGFIVRYKANKIEETGMKDAPWHLRYVGLPHSELMEELDLCLEEYIEYLKAYRYYKNPLQIGTEYSIYYVPMTGGETTIPIPSNKKYTLSGNNIDGFIVTISLENKN